MKISPEFLEEKVMFRKKSKTRNMIRIFAKKMNTSTCCYCCCSIAQLCPTLCDTMDCSVPGFPILHYLPKFGQLMSIESMRSHNHLILCCHFFSFLQSFPASGSFPMSWLFTSGVQSIGASASILPMNIQGWFLVIKTIPNIAKNKIK